MWHGPFFTSVTRKAVPSRKATSFSCSKSDQREDILAMMGCYHQFGLAAGSAASACSPKKGEHDIRSDGESDENVAPEPDALVSRQATGVSSGADGSARRKDSRSALIVRKVTVAFWCSPDESSEAAGHSIFCELVLRSLVFAQPGSLFASQATPARRGNLRLLVPGAGIEPARPMVKGF